MQKKHLFVVNPKAGLGSRTGDWEAVIQKAMDGRDEPFFVKQTTGDSDAAGIVRRHLSCDGAWRVYACGGDGTLNQIVGGAYGHPDAAVTHLPCGTGNDFVKTFGKHARRFRDPKELLDGDEITLDVMRVNDRLAINICSVGFDADVAAQVYRFKRFRRLGSRAPYNLAVLRCLLRGIHRPYEIHIDGQRFEGRYTMVVAANGQFYGGGFHACPDALPGDGLLEFLLVKRVSPLKLLRLMELYAKGRYRDMPEVIHHVRGHHMTVSCAQTADFNADGEILRGSVADMSLCPQKIRFIVPRGAAAALRKP